MGVLEPDAVQSHTAGPLQLDYLQCVQLFVPIPLLVFVTLAKGVVQHRLLKITLTSKMFSGYIFYSFLFFLLVFFLFF